ncbi:MAG: hypothetical protein WC365_08030 [Candidatus Babeliales bacterium]|jgi:hypothetical protein
MKKITGAKTRLEKAVQAEINNHAQDYNESGAKGFLEDLTQGGCQSGMVGNLIYYTDTVKFYKKHKKEIADMLKETLSETGIKSPAELFGDKWDSEDIFAEDTTNQNLLAWFGFEETAIKLAIDNGIEI